MFAFLAAVFYAINVPISKVLLQHVGPTTMAALLYLGAGIGIGIMSLFNKKDREKAESLTNCSDDSHCLDSLQRSCNQKIMAGHWTNHPVKYLAVV